MPRPIEVIYAAEACKHSGCGRCSPAKHTFSVSTLRYRACDTHGCTAREPARASVPSVLTAGRGGYASLCGSVLLERCLSCRSVWLCAAWKWKKAARSGEQGSGSGTVNSFADFDANLLWGHRTVITLVLLTLQPCPVFAQKSSPYIRLHRNQEEGWKFHNESCCKKKKNPRNTIPSPQSPPHQKKPTQPQNWRAVKRIGKGQSCPSPFDRQYQLAHSFALIKIPSVSQPFLALSPFSCHLTTTTYFQPFFYNWQKLRFSRLSRILSLDFSCLFFFVM